MVNYLLECKDTKKDGIEKSIKSEALIQYNYQFIYFISLTNEQFFGFVFS